MICVLFRGKTHTNVIFDVVLAPGCGLSEEDVYEIIEKKVKEVDPSYFIVITFDRGYTNLQMPDRKEEDAH